MENLEPLLKEKEEKFSFQNDKKDSDKSNKKELVITIVIGAFMLYLLWFTLYPFYVGFVNYDMAHPEVVTSPDPEELPLDNATVREVYSYINSTNDNELLSIYSDIYNIDLDAASLGSEQKLAIVFQNLGITCNSSNTTVNLDDVKNLSMKIFNDISAVDALNNEQVAHFYSVSKITDTTFDVTPAACIESSDFTYKRLVKATTLDDELYLYEAHGYFVNIGNDTYNVFAKFSRSDADKVTTFVDSKHDRNFEDIDALRQYKWTFKKSDSGSYYLVSVKPILR